MSVVRVEGATKELGAGAGTETPDAPAAGLSAAATRQRGKHALKLDDPDAPRMAPVTPALKSTIKHISFRRRCRRCVLTDRQWAAW